MKGELTKYKRKCKINYDKIHFLSKIFKKKEIMELINKAEENDIQYKVVNNINIILFDEIKSGFIIVSAALVSYMLSTKGEKHWKILEEYVGIYRSKDVREIITLFVKNSPSLRLYRNNRIKRMERIINNFYPLYFKKYNIYKNNFQELRKDLSSILKTSKDSKTIVFSLKMFYYHLKVLGEKTEIPRDIPIPVDYRITLISLLNNLIILDDTFPSIRDKALIARKYCSEEIREAWQKIANITSISPLKLDTLLWVLGRCIDPKVERKKECIERIIATKLSMNQIKALEKILGIKMIK